MKKTLLLLFLFLNFSIYAQIPPLLPPPLNCCDNNNDGFGSFDLASRIPALLNGMNPATTTVSFYETEVDSQNSINPITNLTSYVNIVPNTQRMYVRIVDNTNGNVYHPNFDLVVFPTPTANPATLQFCDMMELAIYDLHQADLQITAGAAASFVTYYETLADAQTQSNPIVNSTYVPLINPGTQTLYATVTNPSTFCFAITTLTLNTHNCGEQCPAPTNLTATNITDTSFTLNWQYNPGWIGSIFMRVLILPFGSPPPTGNVAGTIDFSSALPNYTFTGLSTDACYSVYIKKYCTTTTSSGWSVPLNICMPNCADSGACSEVLILNAFLDSNNNGIKDPGEQNFNHGNFVYQINDSGANQYGTSNNGSYYIFDSNPVNSYDINFTINSELSAYYTSSVFYTNVTLPDGSGANYLYFPIINILPHVDAQVNLTPYGQPRPGFTYINSIYYRNNGLETIANGTLTFTKASTVSISSVSESGVTTTSTGFTYDFTNLAPNEGRYINVTLLVPTIPEVGLGDLVTNNVTIQIANDINLSNNSSSITQTIVGSYDPNDKMESHGGKIVYSTFTANDYLYYTIQFENTGTASAEFIRVEDALDSQLDENTFEMLSASHNVNTKRIGNQLTWHFYNINLPPTSSNPNGSHGYLSFRIKPKAGYAIGDIIPNQASIYFDYNPAIVTNQFNTEFVHALGNPTFNANTISLYPNPTSEIVTISNSNENDKIVTVVIYEVSGKKIYTLNKNTLNTIQIDVSNFARGLYLVELTSDNNTKITKKLILK